MQRTVLNRHRRGYATKERVQRHVPFLVSGPIGLARSHILNFQVSSSSVFTSPLSSTILKSYLSTDPIALSRAVVPIHTSFIWVSRNLDKQILLMQLGIKHSYKLKCISIVIIVRLKSKWNWDLSCTDACLEYYRS